MRFGWLFLVLIATAAEPTSPHRPSSTAAPEARCGACHVEIPPAGAPPAEAQLLTDDVEVCGTCHPAVPHRGVLEHLGQVVAADVRATLPPTIALAEGGAVACWSCHEVHVGTEAGMGRRTRLSESIEALTGLAADQAPGTRTSTSLLALPLADGALCRACHGDGPGVSP